MVTLDGEWAYRQPTRVWTDWAVWNSCAGPCAEVWGNRNQLRSVWAQAWLWVTPSSVVVTFQLQRACPGIGNEPSRVLKSAWKWFQSKQWGGGVVAQCWRHKSGRSAAASVSAVMLPDWIIKTLKWAKVWLHAVLPRWAWLSTQGQTESGRRRGLSQH